MGGERVWKLVKLSAMPAAVAIPRNKKKKKIILPFILLVLVVLFDCR